MVCVIYSCSSKWFLSVLHHFEGLGRGRARKSRFFDSVTDPDPGSGAFRNHVSGILDQD
jgi:hypothetical protein